MLPKNWGRFEANPLIQVLTGPSLFLSGVVQSTRKQMVSLDSLGVVKKTEAPSFSPDLSRFYCHFVGIEFSQMQMCCRDVSQLVQFLNK